MCVVADLHLHSSSRTPLPDPHIPSHLDRRKPLQYCALLHRWCKNLSCLVFTNPPLCSYFSQCRSITTIAMHLGTKFVCKKSWVYAASDFQLLKQTVSLKSRHLVYCILMDLFFVKLTWNDNYRRVGKCHHSQKKNENLHNSGYGCCLAGNPCGSLFLSSREICLYNFIQQKMHLPISSARK